MNMILILYGILILILIIVILSVLWRYASRRYTLPCPVWMKWLLDPPFSESMSSRTRLTIERLDIQPGMNILDAGCGPGRLTIPMTKLVRPHGTVTAMDLQEGMLHEVQERAKKGTIENIRYIQSGLGEGSVENNFYDRAVMITVLGEIPDRKAALQEIYNALKPGGVLLIEETIRDPHFQSRGTVRALASSIGYVEKNFFGNRFSYTLILEK